VRTARHGDQASAPETPSGTSDWTCRSDGCRMPLGRIADGTLVLYVPAESIDARGTARVPCPRCGRVKVWFVSYDCPPRRGHGRPY
jgi:hypothetical protein